MHGLSGPWRLWWRNAHPPVFREQRLRQSQRVLRRPETRHFYDASATETALADSRRCMKVSCSVKLRAEPFPHASASEFMGADQAQAMLSWLETEAPWKLR